MRFNLFAIAAIAFFGMTLLSSCGDDLETETFNYAFSESYTGAHADDFSAAMTITELDNGGAEISVELTNTVDGETYPMHAHDAADSAATPNMTPYVEAPNAAVFASMAVGNGGTVTVTGTTTMSFEELTTTYDGFFVIHDPLQAVSTSDLTTFLVVDAFAR